MGVVEVVKYNGTPDIVAWKFPSEELGTWTQLIVNESQEAILFKGGQALDVFGPGRHTLETANIPLLNRIINLPFGGRSPFTAEVWFVNKLHLLDIKWGTTAPIQLQDPKYKVFIPLRAFGQFGIQVAESKKFLTTLVGTMSVFDRTTVTDFFKGIYLTNVKDAISSYLIKQGVSMLEINAYLVELSEHLRDRISPTMDEYGISLINFFVKNVSVPEDDPAVMQLKAALAKRAEMDIIGFDYTQERSFDTLEGAATNPGAGQAGVMGAGIGMGMGFGIGGAMGGQMGNMANTINTQANPNSAPQQTVEAPKNMTACANCGHSYSMEYKFCPKCSNPYNPCSACGADMKEGSSNCTGCGKSAPKPCPKCNTAILNENAKFCPECGESLVNKCDGCGNAVDGSPKFCPECGKNLKG